MPTKSELLASSRDRMPTLHARSDQPFESGEYCWCVHALQTSTLCEGSGTHRPLLVYRFSAASLHNSMPDSFSLDTYHLEHICEDTQSRIFELCSSRGGLRFRRAAISSKWERRVGDRRINPQSCTTKTKCGNKSNGEETSQKELHSQSI